MLYGQRQKPPFSPQRFLHTQDGICSAFLPLAVPTNANLCNKTAGKNVKRHCKCPLGKKERLVTADPLQFPAYLWGPRTAHSSRSKRLPGPAPSKAMGTLLCVGTFLVVTACWQKAMNCCSWCPGAPLHSGKIVYPGVKIKGSHGGSWGRRGPPKVSQPGDSNPWCSHDLRGRKSTRSSGHWPLRLLPGHVMCHRGRQVM